MDYDAEVVAAAASNIGQFTCLARRTGNPAGGVEGFYAGPFDDFTFDLQAFRRLFEHILFPRMCRNWFNSTG